MDATAEQLAERLTAAFSAADSATVRPGLWRTLLKLLSLGQPVTVGQLAHATGRPPEALRQALATLPDTEYDQAGRIVGSGITLNPTPHRFTVDGRQLFTWCALDTLIFPGVLGRTARVQSPCHATGTPVHLTVEPNKLTQIQPATAMISIVTPDDLTSVRSAFCNQVHFFASAEAAAPWLAQHPQATVVPVEQALALGRSLAITFQEPDHTGFCC